MGTTADKLNKLKQTKQAIKAAIVNKGVEVTDTDTFASYASKIDSIQTGGSGGGFVIPNGVKLGHSLAIPDNIDTSKVTDMSYMFYGCYITTIPQLDTSKVTDMSHTFQHCYYLTTIPLIDTSNVISMSSMFANSKLTTIPQLDTSNVTDMSLMFNECGKLTTIPQLDTNSKLTYMYRMFGECYSLAYLKLINLGASQKITELDLSYSSSLGDDTKVAGSRQALIDTLVTYSFDRATAGYSALNVSLSSTTKALLTEDEIAQITAKGFTIA